MTPNLKTFLFCIPEAVSLGVFGAACVLALILNGAISGRSSDDDAILVAVFGTVAFGHLQRTHYRKFYRQELSQWRTAVRSVARFNLIRLSIPVAMFIAGSLGPKTVAVKPAPASVAGFTMAVFIAWLFDRSNPSRKEFARGTNLSTFTEAKRRATQASMPDESLLVWGALSLPERLSEGGFLIVGAPGTGKTVSLRLLMQSVIRNIGLRADYRALVYDAKRDMLPLLAGMGFTGRIIILNPFDARSRAWDMARDLNDPATTLEIAAILIPTRQGDSHPFFTKAAQAILAGVLMVFILKCPGNWSLRDVLLAVEDSATLKRVLSSTPQTTTLVDQYFTPEHTFHNILQTIATETAALKPIAAFWHHSDSKFSLTEWLGSDAILVLGSDWTYTETLRSVNRLIFKRLTQLVLNASESRTRRTWFFIDELKETGNLDGLPSLLSFGRSKGVRVALGFQDIDGLRHVFGERPANEIVGLCRNKSILRLDSEVTARWAAAVVGEELGSEYTEGKSSGPQGSTHSLNEHIYKRDAVLPSEFMRLPPADDKSFPGYHIIPSIGVYSATWQYRSELRPPGETPDFVPRSANEQHIVPWNDDDLRRLGLSVNRSDDSPAPAELTPLISIQRLTRISNTKEGRECSQQ